MALLFLHCKIFCYFCNVAYAASGVRFDDAGALEHY